MYTVVMERKWRGNRGEMEVKYKENARRFNGEGKEGKWRVIEGKWRGNTRRMHAGVKEGE